ncbi:hypothetical protein CR513_04141, partial [Mucuna pruriens]
MVYKFYCAHGPVLTRSFGIVENDKMKETVMKQASSMEGQGSTLTDSSATTGLNINEDNRGSGSELEEAEYEEPPRRDCKAPSRNSFLNIENVEPKPPFLTLLLRCTQLTCILKLYL